MTAARCLARFGLGQTIKGFDLQVRGMMVSCRRFLCASREAGSRLSGAQDETWESPAPGELVSDSLANATNTRDPPRYQASGLSLTFAKRWRPFIWPD